MATNLEKLIADVENIDTGYDAFKYLRRVAGDYALEKFSFMGISGPINQLDQTLILNNWDPGLIKAYDEFNLAENSCVWDRLRRLGTPFCWEIETLSQSRSKEEAKIANELFLDYNMSEGVFIPVHQLNSQPIAIGFSGNENTLKITQIAELQFLATHAASKLDPRLFENNQPICKLSPRETECLKWTSIGKTSADISIILSISEHTVNHHLTGAIKKLGAVNRIHAVSIATVKGFLH